MVINIRQFLMLVLQIRHINQGDQLPAVEQSHAVANFLHLVQVVGREQDGQSLLPAQLPNELDELLNTGNVSMDELEHQLNPDYFFRANRQYIINVEHVLFLGNYFGGKLIVRLKGYPKTEIQVSKEKAQRLKEWIDR